MIQRLFPALLASTIAVAAHAEAPLYKSRFKTLDGKQAAVAQWRGKPLVVNFWATWCAPCREEIPEFIQLQKKYAGRVQFVGIAIDDAVSAQAFIKQYKVNYPNLIGEADVMKAMQLEGNVVGGLPFTTIYDARGNKVAAELGRLRASKLDGILKKLTTQPKSP
ncbi:MAG TPA: TlpA disulfide reductase family protein [Chitinolyticbacter sp.]|nr:TlpA disulfide reductase family protein [Chitinolyticbacter sp.]